MTIHTHLTLTKLRVDDEQRVNFPFPFLARLEQRWVVVQTQALAEPMDSGGRGGLGHDRGKEWG